MAHPICRVKSVELVRPFTLRVVFDDGFDRTIDFSGIFAGELFEPLRDADFFGQFRLDPEAHTVVWPNGADFDPETLHNWPQYESAFREHAAAWAQRALRASA
jgi:hypothetical protein